MLHIIVYQIKFFHLTLFLCEMANKQLHFSSSLVQAYCLQPSLLQLLRTFQNCKIHSYNTALAVMMHQAWQIYYSTCLALPTPGTTTYEIQFMKCMHIFHSNWLDVWGRECPGLSSIDMFCWIPCYIQNKRPLSFSFS